MLHFNELNAFMGLFIFIFFLLFSIYVAKHLNLPAVCGFINLKRHSDDDEADC